LIDTGATISFITSKTIKELGLTQTNTGKINVAFGKEQKTGLYICLLLIKNHNKTLRLEMGEIQDRDDFDVIIGMDIISKGELIIRKNQFYFQILELL